ncbi:MAG: hypothetical protein LDL24_03235 [Treponema sp.]|nr:hypothetical protein [Treponema sp.]
MMHPEDLYRSLIDEIPPDLRIELAYAGTSHCMVATEEGIGSVMTLPPSGPAAILPEKLEGLPLRTVAEAVLSWNATDAALGAAALNAYYNSPRVLQKNFGFIHSAVDASADPFVRYAEQARGKKVASIGHFASVERHIAPVATSLYIIEEHPQEGDYPAAAAEYLLPEMDIVFITGSTLANKTLPRLLELSRHAFVVLVGPSTCMAPQLFSYGVSVLSGSLYTDRETCLSLVRQGLHGKMVHQGQKLSYEAFQNSASFEKGVG